MSDEIGVIIPTLNASSYIESTLIAIRSQIGCTVKLIVVDSGSSDETLAICDRFKVQIVYERPGNMYKAINTGMRLLKTRWVTYLNSDDLIYPDSYTQLIQYGESMNADLVYGNCDYINKHGTVIYSMCAANENLLNGLFIDGGIMGFAQPAAIFKNSLYQKLGGFNEEFHLISDFDFFARAVESNVKIKHLQLNVSLFRLHEKQLSHLQSEKCQYEMKEFLSKRKRQNYLLKFITLTKWRTSNIPQYIIRMLKSM